MRDDSRSILKQLLDRLTQEPLDRHMSEQETAEAGQDFYTYNAEEQRRYEAEHSEEQRVEGLLRSWNRSGGEKQARGLYKLLCTLIMLVFMAVMLYTISFLPGFGSAEHPINNDVSRRYIEQGLQETGAVNIVTGMILDYRAFDTLGESTVLFTAAIVVLLLLRRDEESEKWSPLAAEAVRAPHSDSFYEPQHDSILQGSARILVPVILLFGVYIVLNGHLSPGGGFSGGAIMGAGLTLWAIAFGFEDIRRFFTYRTYQRVVLVSLLTYALSKCYSFYTGANHIESIIPLGTPGAILSSGLILVLNICVGFIVTCTMYCFYAMFRKGEL